MLQGLAELFVRFLGALRARWFLRCVDQVGRGVRLGTGALVRNDGTIKLGDRVCFHPGLTGVELTAMFGGTLEIQDDTMINYGCSFTANRLVRIGARCRIGIGVIITDSHLHVEAPARRSLRPEPSAVIIEDDVWLANRVIVLPGVSIGKGSIIGAGSVVTRSIPAGVMAAGNPAQPIRPIHDDDAAESAEMEAIAQQGQHAVSGFHSKMEREAADSRVAEAASDPP